MMSTVPLTVSRETRIFPVRDESGGRRVKPSVPEPVPWSAFYGNRQHITTPARLRKDQIRRSFHISSKIDSFAQCISD
jgi:hypothetical protein